jgi:hypothetical protein
MMKTLSNAGNSQYPEIPKCKNAQVETISRVELAWLAGVIDGEGSIGIYRDTHRKKPRMRTTIKIANTDVRIIARVSEILFKANIRFYYTLTKRRLFCLTIHTIGFRSCKKLLEMVLPYLVGKKDQAKLMVEYLTYRISLFQSTADQRRASNGWFIETPEMQYGEIDEYYYNKIHELKKPPIDPQRLQRRASQPLQLG